MADPLLSLVVPVHNAEADLDGLFTMIENQVSLLPPGSVEVVLVDDASTDRSAEMIERFSADHPGWVQVVRLDENSGVGVARRSALDVVRGTFLLWLDADDELHAGALGQVVDAARASDGDTILVLDYRYRLADGTYRPGRGMAAETSRGLAPTVGALLRGEISPYFWNKVVPRHGLRSEHFATRRNGQDWLTMVGFLSVHPRVERVPVTVVDYVQQSGTLSRRTDLPGYTSPESGLVAQMRQLLEQHGIWDSCRDAYERWYLPRISVNSALASARRDDPGPDDTLPIVRRNIRGMVGLGGLLAAMRRGDRVAAAALVPLWISPALFRRIARR